MLDMTSGLMGLSAIVMAFALLMRAGSERKANEGRTPRLPALPGQIRKQVRAVSDGSASRSLFTHPDPARLWRWCPPTGCGSGAPTTRTSPRCGSASAAAVGAASCGARRPSRSRTWSRCVPAALRRFMRALHRDRGHADRRVPARVRPGSASTGSTGATGALVRAIVAQLATFHAPEDLRIACAGRRPAGGTGTGASGCRTSGTRTETRRRRRGADGLRRLATRPAARRRGAGDAAGFDPGATSTAGRTVPGGDPGRRPDPGAADRLAGPGYRNLVAIDADGAARGRRGHPAAPGQRDGIEKVT